ncbi:MAG: glycosyltransferase family 1 protein [Acidimicrobiales bacterium]
MTPRPGDGPPPRLERGVLVVVEPLRRAVPGGIGTYTRALVGALAALVGADRPRCRLYAARSRVSPDPLGGLGFPVETSRWPDAALVRAWGFGLGRVGRRAALVHAVSLAAPPTAAPLVVTVHDLAWRAVPEAFPARGRRWHEQALRRAARRAACLVVPSEATAQALREAGLGVGDDRIAVIAEGSDHLATADPAATDEALAQLGVGGDFLLAVGTREPRKNLARLFDAYAIARPRFPEPLPLVVVGPVGWGTATAAPPAGVVFAGQVGDGVLAGLYGRARLVAYVPLVEGFGLPVVEAMRAGAPVVASAVPASGGAAHEVDPRDVEAIADGLVRVASDGALRAGLVARGLARVGPLTWRAAAEGHLAVWRRIVGTGP